MAANKILPLKSIHGRRCLSKCYDKGVKYLHPILLTEIVHELDATCAIEPIYTEDIKYKSTYDMILTDKCRIEDNLLYKQPDELESTLLSFYFNPTDFLINIYGIYSFDQTISWTLENSQLPFDTIKRVHNCAWKAFGNKLEEITSTVLEYYYDIAKNHWLVDYIEIILTKYSFQFIPTNEKITPIDLRKQVYQIIMDKFFNFHFFVNIIKKYILENQANWENIVSHYGQIKNYVFDKLIENIELETNEKT